MEREINDNEIVGSDFVNFIDSNDRRSLDESRLREQEEGYQNSHQRPSSGSDIAENERAPQILEDEPQMTSFTQDQITLSTSFSPNLSTSSAGSQRTLFFFFDDPRTPSPHHFPRQQNVDRLSSPETCYGQAASPIYDQYRPLQTSPQENTKPREPALRENKHQYKVPNKNKTKYERRAAEAYPITSSPRSTRKTVFTAKTRNTSPKAAPSIYDQHMPLQTPPQDYAQPHEPALQGNKHQSKVPNKNKTKYERRAAEAYPSTSSPRSKRKTVCTAKTRNTSPKAAPSIYDQHRPLQTPPQDYDQPHEPALQGNKHQSKVPDKNKTKYERRAAEAYPSTSSPRSKRKTVCTAKTRNTSPKAAPPIYDQHRPLQTPPQDYDQPHEPALQGNKHQSKVPNKNKTKYERRAVEAYPSTSSPRSKRKTNTSPTISEKIKTPIFSEKPPLVANRSSSRSHQHKSKRFSAKGAGTPSPTAIQIGNTQSLISTPRHVHWRSPPSPSLPTSMSTTPTSYLHVSRASYVEFSPTSVRTLSPSRSVSPTHYCPECRKFYNQTVACTHSVLGRAEMEQSLNLTTSGIRESQNQAGINIHTIGANAIVGIGTAGDFTGRYYQHLY